MLVTRFAKPRIATATIVAMLASPIAPLVAQAPATAKPNPAPTTAKPSGPAPSVTGSPAGVATDGDWPRGMTTKSGAELIIYQPQISSWADQKHAEAFAAVSYTPKATTKPALGTIKLTSETSVAMDERLVSFADLKVLEPSFSTLSRDQLRTAVEEITAMVPSEARVIGLDRVLANIDTSQVIPKNIQGLKADPPTIFFSKTPAVLVNLDGEPIWSPIPQNDLSSAVNTNWDLFQHNPTKTLYLRNERVWMKATDVKGPWEPAGKLPDSFSKLPADENWKEVKASLPGQKVSANKAAKVYVSLQPAELILLRGEPNYLAVQGASPLVWVSNTESDVFRTGATGSVYFLVAGRWFSAPDFTGPWTFATPNMPPAFKQIPVEHDRSRVLASVPGTRQAAEAVMLAQIPQTARVSKTLKAPDVEYQGTPQFQPIETTTVQRAVNTDKDIIKVGDLYYMCFQGVWFMSKTATGPWEVTGEVPKEIYEIPISSPSHSVTYVTVEDDDDDDAIVFATAMAFTGLMVGFGCAMWGSGYYYPPYVGYGGFYPAYYPHYPTYGYGASYNPWTGAYTRGAVAYGPYGGAGAAARYNPRTGTYSRGAVAYGPGGSRGAASAYNPRTGTGATTRQGSNVYGSWGSTAVARGDDWAKTSRVTNNRTGETTRVTRTSNGDVYAGRDGNVYRKSGDSYQKYDNGGWNNVDAAGAQQRAQDRTGQAGTARAGTAQAGTAQAGTAQTRSAAPATSGMDASTRQQVTRDSSARAEGATRTRDQSQVRSGSSTRSSSYRASGATRSGGGGGMRSGGGRRR